MSHYPNPFDFVPFPAAPILRTEEQFDALGEKFSGYLELEIKALTPVHIVGKVEADPYCSFMYRQDGKPCIPASSIRGCLRAFTEALTASWVSQANPKYEKEYRSRHVGFHTFEKYKPVRSGRGRTSPAAVNEAFKPGSGDGKLDVASYLFGVVTENKNMDHDELARKSKVWVEDAYLSSETVAFREDLWVPDIAGAAFMGGAKPSASNWWYFLPAEVWGRNLPFGTMAEFVGEHLRGRKFYYHQDPAACVRMYHPDSNFWTYSVKKPFHPVRLESMLQDTVTQPFRLYLDGVPRPLFLLLLRVLLLQPGATMRHKVGYAKAYGYGSIEFALKSARLRTVSFGIPNALQPWRIVAGSWSEAALEKSELTDFIDRNALTWLARILGWPHADIVFLYPRYKEQEFQQVVRYGQFSQKLTEQGMTARKPMMVTSEEARAIAEALWDLKRPIDFRLYQERAEGWNTITQRKP